MSTTTKRAKRATIFGAALPILIIFVSGCALIALLATANLDNQAGVTEEARAATDEPTFMPSDTPRPTATRVPHPTNTPQIDAAGQPTTGAPQATQPSTATETATPATLSTVGGESPTEISFTQAPATEISFTQVPATEISYTQVPASPGLPYSGHISNVGSYLNTIYMHGQQLGNNPRAFSKIGDCEAAFPVFLQDFDKGNYDLVDYQYLGVVLGHFAGSFVHVGQAADGGMSSTALLNSLWADPDVCNPGETPLACEYRTHRPSVALIMVRTIDANAVANGQYHSELTQIVQYSLGQGIIPVLSTVPYWGPWNPDTSLINDTIRRVASENNVPLWDFWVTSEQLPNRGVTQDYHIADPAYPRATFFDADSLRMAVTRRNLEALEVLHAVLTQVSQN
jgi:hypothetical protein